MRCAAAFATATAALFALACGSAPPPVEPPERPALPALPMLVPDGASIVVIARPAEILRDDAMRAVVHAVAPPLLLDSFARRTGVEPTEVEELIYAVFDEGELVIARGPFRARDVVIAAERRMAGVETRADEPFVRRAGFLRNERVDLAAVADDVVVVVEDAPALAATVLACARDGRFPEGRTAALAAPEATRLAPAHEGAPLVLHAPTPLELPPGLGTSVLLARERALVASVRRAAGDPTRLAVQLALEGEFPPGAQANFRALVESLGQSDLGGALGMAEALPTLTVAASDRDVEITFSIPATSVASGLRALFSADVEQVLGDPPNRP